MKATIKLLLFIAIPFTISAQEGIPFPSIEVNDLNEKSLVIPDDTKGKFTLVGIAFSEDAQEDLYTWSQPVFSEFLDDNNLASLVYDPNMKLILMFTGANRLAYDKAKQQITEGTDKNLKNYVVLYNGKMEDYRKELHMKDRKKPYFFVLDKQGKIIYTAEGSYSREVLEEVGDLIEE